MYFHAHGKIKQALLAYSASLGLGGPKSDNSTRKQVLEQIEFIISELRSKKTQQLIKVHRAPRQGFGRTMPRMLSWNNCNSIYRHLGRHYILTRSIVVILDDHFENQNFHCLAMEKAQKLYEELDTGNFFGLLSLKSQAEASEELVLQCLAAKDRERDELVKRVTQSMHKSTTSASNLSNAHK